ncbi:MAG: YbjQ family protein [Gammaproteobacteria bacterium]
MYELIFFLVLLFLGYFIGQMLENSHYKSIRKRESQLNRIPVIASRKLPDEFQPCETTLVAGNVVISIDFFKKFIAGLRNLVGGRVTSYETLIDRARREALLRMKEEARRKGAQYVFNVKMETSSISKGKRETIGSVEVLAYGTAIIQPPATTAEKVTGTAGSINLRPV